MANPLWEYSRLLYGEPGVADICIGLQDKFGVNINLLLFCCWLDSNRLPLDSAFLQRAQASVEHWDKEVVQPMRRCRRRAKSAAGDWYRKLLKLELEAERIEQNILLTCYTGAVVTRGKEKTYLASYVSQFEGLDWEELAPLLLAAAKNG